MYKRSKLKFIGLNFALFILSAFSFAQNNPTHFKSELDFGNGTVISTFLDVRTAENTFTITSPKNADVRMLGGFKARLARMIGKMPKKGIIVTIKGEQKSDSLFGQAGIPVFGRLKFRGIIKDQSLSGEFLHADGTVIGNIHGVNTSETKNDYNALYSDLVKTIADNIYSKRELQTKSWKKFDKKLKKLYSRASDDIEVFFGFSMLAPKLPFSHLNLLIAAEGNDTQNENENENESEEPVSANTQVIFEQKNDSTAYLQIKNFATSADELYATLPGIVANKAYKHLIIDLRDNGGGGIDAAFALAKYIVREDLEVGYFPTNKLTYSGFQPEVFKTLPELQPKSTEEFGNELRVSPGVKLIFRKPVTPVFTGKLYILTNGNTASTCEPIVYALKSTKMATIIGENTMGAMLSASPFYVQKKFLLLLPVGDFYTHDGIRLDKVGVKPDVEVKSAEALEKALEIISH